MKDEEVMELYSEAEVEEIVGPWLARLETDARNQLRQTRRGKFMEPHDCGKALLPIPEWADPLEMFRADHPEYGLDEQGRKCFAIDACIAPAVEALWAAGIWTTSSCCGHGQSAGGTIGIDTTGRTEWLWKMAKERPEYVSAWKEKTLH